MRVCLCPQLLYVGMSEAMQKDFFSGFSIFAKDKTVFISYSNLIQNKFDNMYSRKFRETSTVQNPVLEYAKMTTKIIEFTRKKRK